MSWNGNDLFNSTLMGGMPSGADPHQYLTTDGNGKPHWEDKLAYEESAVVEIMPTTNVGTIWYSQKTVACPHNGAVKVGDTGYLYIDGTPYKYTAIEKVFSGGPPVVVQLDVEGKSSTSELIGLTDANKLLFYNCSFGSPSSTHTVSMTHNSTTIKTLDPKYLPSGSGGGGVIYVDLELIMQGAESTSPVAIPAYADAALASQLTYEQGKNTVYQPHVIAACAGGVIAATFTPMLTQPDDESKVVSIVMANPALNGMTTYGLIFTDTTA